MDKKELIANHYHYTCPECDLPFKTFLTWAEHLRLNHNYKEKSPQDLNFIEHHAELHECKICQRYLIIKQNIINFQHYFSHIDDVTIYKCVHCKYRASRKTDIYFHLKHKHNELLMQNSCEEYYLIYRCPQCGQLIKSFREWHLHLSSHNSTSTQLGMQSIAGKQHICYCVECKRVFQTKDRVTLQKHRFTHLPFPKYLRCTHCKISKSTKMELLQHFQEVHAAKYAEVSHLLKPPVEWGHKVNAFSLPLSAAQPIFDSDYFDELTHTGTCSLQRHIHYLCAECGREFELRVDWRSHYLQAHKFDISVHFLKLPNEGCYKCLQCFQKQSAGTRMELQLHSFTHLPYSAYIKCNYCKSCLPNKAKMLTHMAEMHASKLNDVKDKMPYKIKIFEEPADLTSILQHLTDARVRLDIMLKK